MDIMKTVIERINKMEKTLNEDFTQWDEMI